MVKKKVLVVLAGGGFYGEMSLILKKINRQSLDLSYVTADDSKLTLKGLPANKCFIIPKTTHFSTKSVFNRIKDFYKSTKEAKKVIDATNPDIIIALGSSLAIPLFLCAFFQNSQKIFIESLTRVNGLSRTGKLIYYSKIANKFYVQWPKLIDKYPKSVYRGKTV